MAQRESQESVTRWDTVSLHVFKIKQLRLVETVALVNVMERNMRVMIVCNVFIWCESSLKEILQEIHMLRHIVKD